MLAQYTPPGHRQGTHGGPGIAIPLYDRKTPGGTQTAQLKAPPPIAPGKPIDVQQMEALNKTVQNFNVKSGPDGVTAKELSDAQRHFQAATDALKAGDYKKAEQELSQLGFPLPAPGSGQSLKREAKITAALLGITGPIAWGKGGSQALNDVNGFAANAIMLNRMATAPAVCQTRRPKRRSPDTCAIWLTLPRALRRPRARPCKPPATSPTAPSCTTARPAKPIRCTARTRSRVRSTRILRAGFTTSTRRKPLTKPRQPATRRSRPAARSTRCIPVRPTSGATSRRRARVRAATSATARARLFCRPPAHGSRLHVRGHRGRAARRRPPWSHVRCVQGARRHSLGHVQPGFQAGHCGGPKKGVTQADLDTTLRTMTAGVYGVRPSKGVLDLHDFKFTAAATANLKSGSVAIDSIRRTSELNMLGAARH